MFVGPQSTNRFDLGSIGSPVATDSVVIRFNLQDTLSLTPKTSFLRDLRLTTVPEPSSALLMGSIALVTLRRRRD